MADKELQFEQHMSDSEALMWNLEKDPAMSSWFASITILDQPPKFDHFRAGLERAAIEIPRLRQRVVPTAGRLSPPEWAVDPEFDLDYHVRRMALPAPGSERQLFDLCAQLLLDPFERTRPLWQFVVIEGLESGEAALFQKMHHTITDGEGGVRLAEKFIELTRDAPMPAPVTDEERAAAMAADVVAPDEDFFRDLGTAAQHNVRRIGGLAGRAVGNFAKDPLGSVNNIGAVVGEVSKALRSDDPSGERVGSPIWQPRTLKRYFGAIRVPFVEAKAASKALGGTINDLFVAGALAGATRYHEEAGDVPDRLRVAMPVSTRRKGTAGGNQFALTTHDLAVSGDPVIAFGLVKEALSVVKSGSSVDLLGSLAAIINMFPTSMLTAFAKDQAASVDFTVSNVRGAPIEIFVAGAKCLANYPMGPISGTGFNLTTLSYNGSLDMGLVADAGAIDDPERLRAHIEAAYEELLAAAAPVPPKKPARKKATTKKSPARKRTKKSGAKKSATRKSATKKSATKKTSSRSS